MKRLSNAGAASSIELEPEFIPPLAQNRRRGGKSE
jgi:hypothetical protein